MKYNEDAILREAKEYIEETYKGHYSGDVEPFELMQSQGLAVGYAQGNIVKYACRLGKKEGYNEADVMKIIHYCCMLVDSMRKAPDRIQHIPVDIEKK